MGGSHKMYTVAQKLAMLPAAAMRTKHLAPSGQWAWRAPKFSKRQVTTLVPPPARGGPPRARACCTAGDRSPGLERDVCPQPPSRGSSILSSPFF